MTLTESAIRFIKGLSNGNLPPLDQETAESGVVEVLRAEVERLQENLVDIELAVDEVGWREMGHATGSEGWNFRRDTLKKMMDITRRMYIMNPLMRRSVDVQALYVWGLGVTIKCQNKDVQEVLDDCFNSPKNRKVLTSQPAFKDRERDQQNTGNNFICLYWNELTGGVRIRILPVDQILQIITNPDDVDDVWFYRRVWSEKGEQKSKCYPDMDYNPEDEPEYLSMDSWKSPIDWKCRVRHVKTGAVSGMLFGVPEYYCIVAYIGAYKRILDNWATIMQAYARLAMKMTGQAGKKGVAAAKSKLGTTVSTGNSRETNPPNNVAGWFLASGGADVSAIKTSGATTGPSEAKPILDMVAAGAGIPNTFYGNADQGNFATSETLDRPTELSFTSRQKLWLTVIVDISHSAVYWSATATDGKLFRRGFTIGEVLDPFDESKSFKVLQPDGEEVFVEVDFPSILERNVTERVRAVVAAATLNGSPAEGIFPDRALLFQLLLEALDEPDVLEKVKQYYPEAVTQGFVDPVDQLAVDKLKAQGTADVGKAAIDQAKTAKIVAKKPAPKSNPAGNKRGVTNRR